MTDRKAVRAGQAQRLFERLSALQGAILNPVRLASRMGVGLPELRAGLRALEEGGSILLLWPWPACREGADAGMPRVYLFRKESHAGPGWEAKVVRTLLSSAPDGTRAGYFRGDNAAEMDLVLEFPGGGERWAIEIKTSASTRLRKPFHEACRSLAPDRAFLVHAGRERFRVLAGVEAIGLEELSDMAKHASRC